MTSISTADRSAAGAKVEALVLFSRPVGREAVLTVAGDFPSGATAYLTRALAALRARGRADEVLLVTGVPEVAAPFVAVAGLGHEDDEWASSPESVRRAAGAAVRALAGRKSIAVVVPSEDEGVGAAVAEGIALGAYRYEPAVADPAHEHPAARHRDEPEDAEPKDDPVRSATLYGVAEDRADKRAAVRAERLGRYVRWARDLVNTPPNLLNPASFADAVAERAKSVSGVKVSVLDEKRLAKEGYGGLVAVGRGSAHPPRLVTLSYAPRSPQSTLAFVGKGITFDSGGLWVKQALGMLTMKCDMAGAAAVAAAVLAIAELQLPVAVTGQLCLAENMPGPDAVRSGDVITMRNGTTVEVLNTDAEGRLVLADGLSLASETHPDAIVDVATLTGASMVALGKRTAAVLANDDLFQGEVTTAATMAGETVWPMPIAEELRANLDTPVADLKHWADGPGGMMLAAAFLREFIGEGPVKEPIPWAHLDVAGPAYNDGAPHGYTPKGGTGFAVRTLVRLAEGRC